MGAAATGALPRGKAGVPHRQLQDRTPVTMLDGLARRLLDPTLDRMGEALAGQRVPADALTFAGLVCGMASALAIALGADGVALLALGLNRLLDGLDGAVARASARTDRGGFLDIVLDFVLYSGIVIAVALADPARNALPAAFLIFSFVRTGAAFLAFAVMAAKRGIATEARGLKSL